MSTSRKKCSVMNCANMRAKGRPRCHEHLAEYQKKYRGTVMDMAERKGFAKGREAMRKMLVAEFSRLSKCHLSGAEVAFAIQNAPAPSADSVTPDNLKSAAGGNVGKDSAQDVAGSLPGPRKDDRSTAGLNSKTTGSTGTGISNTSGS